MSLEWKPEALGNRLYIVPTPIGNRGDITLRALHVLHNADAIACEDTRHTGQLLKSYGIVPRQLIACHEHNERRCAVRIGQLLQQGKSVALLSDAGMPGISDPGFLVVRHVLGLGYEVTALPGASALLPALVGSGLPPQPFAFWGFLPARGSARREWLQRVVRFPWTSVLYEAPHRLLRLLEELLALGMAERPMCLARELTKLHEEFLRGSVGVLYEQLRQRPRIYGECVIVLAGSGSEGTADHL
jgi:16S rRNA (cytidine1402-2'-O)-methyltransferase